MIIIISSNLFLICYLLHLMKKLAINSMILIVIQPVSIWSQFNHGLGLDNLSSSAKESNSFDWFFIIAYCFFPLLVLQIAYKVFRVDPYELLLKFLPVWVAMSVELFLSLAWQLFGIGLPSELLLSRLGLFFLHILYIINRTFI